MQRLFSESGFTPPIPPGRRPKSRLIASRAAWPVMSSQWASPASTHGRDIYQPARAKPSPPANCGVMASVLNEAYFHNEGAAFEALEAILWPDGPVCPHCGVVGRAGILEGVRDKKGNVRLGLWKCYTKECRKQFTVRKGTVFEVQPPQAAPMVSGDLSALLQQQELQQQPACPHAWRNRQNRLVRVSSNS